jgi:hypothetical protein
MSIPCIVINVMKYKAPGLPLTFIRPKPERTCLAMDVPPKNNLFISLKKEVLALDKGVCSAGDTKPKLVWKVVDI